MDTECMLQIKCILKADYLEIIDVLKCYIFFIDEYDDELNDSFNKRLQKRMEKNIPKKIIDNVLYYNSLWRSLHIGHCFYDFSLKEDNTINIIVKKNCKRHKYNLEKGYIDFVEQIIKPMSVEIKEYKIIYNELNKTIDKLQKI